MSVRRHEQQTRTSDSGHGVLAVWLPFCGAGSVETYGGGILVVVEGDAAMPGVFGPQCGVSPYSDSGNGLSKGEISTVVVARACLWKCEKFEFADRLHCRRQASRGHEYTPLTLRCLPSDFQPRDAL